MTDLEAETIAAIIGHPHVGGSFALMPDLKPVPLADVGDPIRAASGLGWGFLAGELWEHFVGWYPTEAVARAAYETYPHRAEEETKRTRWNATSSASHES